MSGWTLTSQAVAHGVARGDGWRNAVLRPALAAGNAPEFEDFVSQVTAEFAELCQKKGLGKNIVVSANNGSGDVQGVGTLTITLTVS